MHGQVPCGTQPIGLAGLRWTTATPRAHLQYGGRGPCAVRSDPTDARPQRTPAASAQQWPPHRKRDNTVALLRAGQARPCYDSVPGRVQAFKGSTDPYPHSRVLSFKRSSFLALSLNPSNPKGTHSTHAYTSNSAVRAILFVLA